MEEPRLDNSPEVMEVGEHRGLPGKGFMFISSAGFCFVCVVFFFLSRNDLSSWEADRMDPTKRERLVRIMGIIEPWKSWEWGAGGGAGLLLRRGLRGSSMGSGGRTKPESR